MIDNKDWDESKHPRDKQGKFARFGTIIVGKGEEPSKRLRDTIQLPDEQLPRSVGAKWANHIIDMQDGSVAHFVEGSKLQNKEVFAGKGCKDKIGDIERLVTQYPGSKRNEWMKVKAKAQIETEFGEYIEAEVHWYEEISIGKVEFKFKKEV